ncbi:hypothetical protein SPHINGO391_450130 [Sphingomonas aurantiaca]|uniref:Uncharacterized protein n=1 Tax=Sphingomonas aurantiaca TaxID=185949 RepID=A0A5E7ZET1_9SPHN|nr:hypothetical protein SPHINGO391_450130 [Sphingomonas aurantiaca]
MLVSKGSAALQSPQCLQNLFLIRLRKTLTPKRRSKLPNESDDRQLI